MRSCAHTVCVSGGEVSVFVVWQMVHAGVTCRTRSKAAHLVTTITHPETTEVANHLIGQGDNVLTAELVHPEELMSGLLSQVLCCCLCAHNLRAAGYAATPQGNQSAYNGAASQKGSTET